MGANVGNPALVGESIRSHILALGSVIGGLTALAAGLAYYSGLTYERAYANEWGISSSALRYDPIQLMTASEVTVALAWILPAIGIGYLVLQRVLFEGGVPRFWRRVSLGVAMVGVIVMLVGLVFLVRHNGVVAFYVILTGVLLIAAVWHVNWQDRAARAGLVVVAVFVFVQVFLFAPDEFGRRDARRDREDGNRLPRVQVAAIRALGLEGEHKEGDVFLTGPMRLVFVNNNKLWITSLSGGVNVPLYEIAESDVASVKYISRTQQAGAIATGTPSAN